MSSDKLGREYIKKSSVPLSAQQRAQRDFTQDSKELLESIEKGICALPLYQYAFIEPSSISFSENVRYICKSECPRYGKSWSCPPAVGSVEKCREKCLSYSGAFLFSTVATGVDTGNMEEMLSTRAQHEKIVKSVEQIINHYVKEGFTLSSESCAVCRECAYPEPCRHPEMMHPCIESHGILVTQLIEDNKMDFFISSDTVLWFGLIFFSA